MCRSTYRRTGGARVAYQKPVGHMASSATTGRRLVRPPAEASLCELYLEGLIRTVDVRLDGKVPPEVRAEAEELRRRRVERVERVDASTPSSPRRPSSASPRRSSAPPLVRRPNPRPSATLLLPPPSPPVPARSAAKESPPLTTTSEPRRTVQDLLLCVVCLTAEREYAPSPCFHLCLCRECCVKMGERGDASCPICRGPICEVRRVYV